MRSCASASDARCEETVGKESEWNRDGAEKRRPVPTGAGQGLAPEESERSKTARPFAILCGACVVQLQAKNVAFLRQIAAPVT